MKFLKATPAALCVALLATAFSPIAKADDFDKKTVVTFSMPVEIPGVHLQGWGVLPAGTYVFKLMNSPADRHIVQIFNKEQTKVYATILAIPNYRLTPTDKTVITFSERPVGSPEAIRAWFYPGANWGEEFVYPKAKAVEFAKVGNLPVLTVVADLPSEVATPDEPSLIAQLRQAPVMAVRPTGELVELAQVVTPAPAARVQAFEAVPAAAAVAELPATASSLPLIAMFGLFALGAGYAMRYQRNRLR